jgi:hypothetical protein
LPSSLLISSPLPAIRRRRAASRGMAPFNSTEVTPAMRPLGKKICTPA